MSLVNAVHELIEVAVGRKNLSATAADELHDAIDAQQEARKPGPESQSEPEPENPTVTAPVPTAQDAPATDEAAL